LDDGDISAGMARRILDDFFEPAGPGERPILKRSVWLACAETERSARVIARMRSGKKRGW
jgi:hypothetical protein